jgi:hypothetical protein
MVCSVLLSADAHSTDTGLELGTPQIHFTCFALWSFAVTFLRSSVHISLFAAHHTDLPWHDWLSCYPLALYAVCFWSWILVTVPVSPCRIFCLILIGEYYGILAALKSKALWVATPLVAAQLFYTTILIEYLFNMQAVLVLSDCFFHSHVNATEKFTTLSKFMQ